MKKIIALSLVFALLFSLCACNVGSNEENKENSSNTSSIPITENDNSNDDSKTEEDSVNKDFVFRDYEYANDYNDIVPYENYLRNIKYSITNYSASALFIESLQNEIKQMTYHDALLINDYPLIYSDDCVYINLEDKYYKINQPADSVFARSIPGSHITCYALYNNRIYFYFSSNDEIFETDIKFDKNKNFIIKEKLQKEIKILEKRDDGYYYLLYSLDKENKATFINEYKITSFKNNFDGKEPDIKIKEIRTFTNNFCDVIIVAEDGTLYNVVDLSCSDGNGSLILNNLYEYKTIEIDKIVAASDKGYCSFYYTLNNDNSKVYFGEKLDKIETFVLPENHNADEIINITHTHLYSFFIFSNGDVYASGNRNASDFLTLHKIDSLSKLNSEGRILDFATLTNSDFKDAIFVLLDNGKIYARKVNF